jgi:hypothetical protein
MRYVAGAAGVLVFGILLSGCTLQEAEGPGTAASESPESGGDPSSNLLDSEGMADEYVSTAQDFPLALPEGIQFPRAIPDGYDPAAMSEPGVGQGIAYFYWMCSWQKAYIDAKSEGDVADQVNALDNLELWKSTSFYDKWFEDPDDLWTKNMLEPARSGDDGELVENYENGCGYYDQHNP